MYFDAHNHLQDPWLTPHRDRVLADLAALPIRACVVNGTSEQDWPEVTTLCSADSKLSTNPKLKTPNPTPPPSPEPRTPISERQTPNPNLPPLTLLPSYGLHPWNVGNASPHWRDTLLHTLDVHPHAFIGEIGLDRWILDRARPDDPRLAGLRRAPLDEQRDAFVWQLRLAADRNLPVTIHCLDAWGALADILRSTPLPARGFLLHAYGGSAELARDFAALGAYFSFNGYFLHERQSAKRDVFRTLPLDRILVETDAPAMPLPASHRTHELPGLADGNPINHPANLPAVYAALAHLRGLPLEELTPTLTQNFTHLFGPIPTKT